MELSKYFFVFFNFNLIFLIKYSECNNNEILNLCSVKYCDCVQDYSVDCTFDYKEAVVLTDKAFSSNFTKISFSNIQELTISLNKYNKNIIKNLKEIKFINIKELNIFTQFTGNNYSIHFENVTIPELLYNTFRTNYARIEINSSFIKNIRKDAFRAIAITSIYISNTSIHQIEDGAFSDISLIESLILENVELEHLHSNAIKSAVSNLSIQHSRISDIYPGGIKTTAVVSAQFFKNIIHRIKPNGIILKDWTHIVIENNTFGYLESNAINVYNHGTADHNTFNIINNAFGPNSQNNALNFDFNTSNVNIDRNIEQINDTRNGTDINVTINENYFILPCDCRFIERIKNIVNKSFVKIFYESSYCKIDADLSQCFETPEGLINIKNFTDTICSKNIVCNPNTNIETTNSKIFPGLTEKFNLSFEGEDPDELYYILIIIVILVVSILILCTCIYIIRNSVLNKIKSNLFVSVYSKLFRSNNKNDKNQMKPSKKLFTNSYLELNIDNNKIDINTDPNNYDLDNIGDTNYILDDNQTVNDNEYDLNSYMNKATQTLPEELTEELLQNLRRKLEDPNEYCIARDMIEHLYDMIKIDENRAATNNNNEGRSDQNHYMSNNVGENIYDEIEVKPKYNSPFDSDKRVPMSTFQTSKYQGSSKLPDISRPYNTTSNSTKSKFNSRNKKFTKSVGTRVPSPDKLLPYDFSNKKQMIVVPDEYQLPRDNNSSYIYSELPPDIPPLPREQLRLLDDVINIYMDSTLGRPNQRPLPHTPEDSSRL